MTNIYTGRIRNVSEWIGYTGYDADRGGIATSFISTEGETKGLSINIIYSFNSRSRGEIFIDDLERRLKEKPEGIMSQVCLSEPLDTNRFEYTAKGPIRFLEDEPPRAA